MNQRVRLQGSKLSFAEYDEREQSLVIEFADHSKRRFKAVPREVFLRLSQAPNAQAYYEDRIVEEYPSERVAQTTQVQARQQLDDLFGGLKSD